MKINLNVDPKTLAWLVAGALFVGVAGGILAQLAAKFHAAVGA